MSKAEKIMYRVKYDVVYGFKIQQRRKFLCFDYWETIMRDIPNKSKLDEMMQIVSEINEKWRKL